MESTIRSQQLEYFGLPFQYSFYLKACVDKLTIAHALTQCYTSWYPTWIRFCFTRMRNAWYNNLFFSIFFQATYHSIYYQACFVMNCHFYSFQVINATSKTSTRVKSYFSRTLSRSNPSNSSTSNASRQPNYFKSSKRDGKEIHFEMPSVSFSTTKPKEGIPVLLNHEYIDKDGNVSSKTNDTNMKVAILVPGTRRHRIGSTNSSSGSESGCESAAEKTQLKTFKEDDNSEIFFRRAKSDLNRLSEKTASIPRRANSVSEVERMQLSKQISNESTVSAVSGRSNTAFLSGC